MYHNNLDHSNLQSVIAIYDNSIMLYPFENGTLQAARLPIKDDFNKLIKLVNTDGKIKSYSFDGIIPNNVLTFKNEEPYIVWYTKPKLQHLLFDSKLPMVSGTYPIPTLIWKFDSSGLSIFATTDIIINEDTKLFQAPFLNVYSHGGVCMGSAMVKNLNTSYNVAMEQLQNNFFNSYFTHTNNDTLINRNIADVYLEQMEKKTKTFDNTLLIDTNLTLNSII